MLVRVLVFCVLFISVVELKNGPSVGKEQLKRREILKSISEDLNHDFDLRRTRRQSPCFPAPNCNSAFAQIYRFMDGRCNNLVTDVHWGSANIPFIRWLPSQYGPGNSPRGTGFNPALPSARVVSAGMVSVVNPPSLGNSLVTLMVMQFGQFLDHDMVFTPEENATSCCNNTSNANCINIDVPTSDTFYGPKNVKCLPLVRSRPSPCVTGREQINERTAFIDASQVYGSSDAQLNDLLFSNSFLLAFGPGRENTSCPANNADLTCRTFLPNGTSSTGAQMFFAGDGRVEESPGLTSIHTIFLRMHNDLAIAIDNQNNCPTDIVILETRRILGAIMQQITYNEFLPIVLGQTLMTSFGLTLGTVGSYSSTLDPSAPNVFATAAFRFGHSLIKDIFTLPSASVNLSRSFNNHFLTTMTNTFPSHFMRGISVDPSEPMDHIIVDAVHNKLFAQAPFTQGEDLYARNIQRGRDHGIAPYPDWVTFTNSCILRPANSFNTLNISMPNQVVAKLMSLYGTIDRVDLFPAAIAEHNVAGGLVGPTFACLIAEYFHRLKFGDRFWFEADFGSNSAQLNAIYNTRLSAIICLYTDATQLPRNVFLPQDPSTNPLTSCTTLINNSVLNLITLWNGICSSSGSG